MTTDATNITSVKNTDIKGAAVPQEMIQTTTAMTMRIMSKKIPVEEYC